MKIVLRGMFLLILILAYVSFNGFTSINELTDFKAIHIVNVFQVPHSSGDLLTFPRSADLIYSKDYEILRERSSKTTTYTKVNHLNEILGERTTVDSSYIFYICRRGEKYGLQYDSLSASIGKHFFVDSLIKYFLQAPSFFYSIRSKGKDSMTVVRENKNGLLLEKFRNRRLFLQDPDSTYFYYRKKPLDFSFLIKDKREDNMYLYKAIAIYNPSPKGTFSNINYDVKKYRHLFEITEINVPDKQKLKRLIDKFEKSFHIIK